MKITFLAFLKVALFYCTTKSQHLFHFSFELIAAIKWSNYKMTHLQTVYQGLYNTYIIFLQFSIFKTYCSSRVKEPSQFYPSKMFVRGQYFLGNACSLAWCYWSIWFIFFFGFIGKFHQNILGRKQLPVASRFCSNSELLSRNYFSWCNKKQINADFEFVKVEKRG